MKTITLITVLHRLARCLLIGSLLAFAGTSLATERVTYYHNDALGSPVAATDANGTLLWREEYAPYGERLKKEAGSKDTVWYTGKQEESTFGLSYFGARWYDPRVGRFMGVDPAGFDEDNIHSYSKYAYANNNPYVYVDPDGNVAETALDIVSFGLSLAAFNSEPSLLNALGLAYDGAATAIPFLPAGFGILKNIGNGIDAAGDVAKSAGKSKITKSSRKRVKRLVKNLSDDSRQNNRLSQEKTDQLRRIVKKADGKVRNDGSSGVKGSSAGKPHVQTEGLGKSIDNRHIWTQKGVQ